MANSEIKFRIGHKANGHCSGCTKRVLVIDFINNVATVLIDDERGNQDTWFLHQSDLLRYTGLKDKNGKEIYEGDIIEWQTAPMSAPEETCRRAITWLATQGIRPYINTTSEVIGNIYENPELLKL